jgi:hypothetical protein
MAIESRPPRELIPAPEAIERVSFVEMRCLANPNITPEQALEIGVLGSTLMLFLSLAPGLREPAGRRFVELADILWWTPRQTTRRGRKRGNEEEPPGERPNLDFLLRSDYARAA